jgi:AbrB family looped-hinge helix DNA binding protein
MLTITKLSSKGQVVIPDEIRKKLGLETGAQFLIYAEKDAIVFKIVQPPPKEDFDKVLARAQAAAKKAGFKKEMIADEIKKYRRERKRK